MSRRYWDYFDDAFDWSDSHERLKPNIEHSRSVFMQNGMSESEAANYVASGYVCFKDFDVVVDRYYGGALNSYDYRCRFPKHTFRGFTTGPKSNVWVYRADSLDDVRRRIDRYSSKSKRQPLFRGQTQSYLVQRSVPNPNLSIAGFGEPSLMPSFWRRLLERNPTSYLSFGSLDLLEWSQVLYSRFDLKDIERRHQELNDAGEVIITMSDMEDCSDPILRQFGTYRLDLACHFDTIWAPVLATMLQHYGLLSPELDLTSSLDVAVFFATHRFRRDNSRCRYEFIGTNRRRAVLYLFREHVGEMLRHEDNHPLIRDLHPLRPERQECVMAHSDTYALNLPADFLEGIVLLDFDLETVPTIPAVHSLFPSAGEDRFLNALKMSPYAQRYLNEFAECPPT